MLLVDSGWTMTLGMVAFVVGKTVLFTHCWQCGEIETDTWAMRKIGLASSVTSSGCWDPVNIGMGEKIGADDTLVVSVVVENYALDHMFTERGFHCNNYWTMGVYNGAIGHFDFTTYRELEQLFVKGAFD
uniref:Uncharacterized protein n=1 Tax=Romanomermis culicivorax TaxID=13658 RepID=A0A915L920_ROMCU